MLTHTDTRRGTARRSVRPSERRLSVVLSGLLPLLLLTVCCSAQAAAPPIEAVWAFNGGEVAVVHQSDGTWSGIVDAPTTFARCSHPVGERMWSGLRPQPDGSYWGLHQWFFESEPCQTNPTLGPSAWRVMAAANGSRYLIVCFSAPGGTQPTIAPDGTTAHVTYRCYDSALLAAVPLQSRPSSRAGAAAFAHAVGLPGNRRCLSRRLLTIHLHNPPFDPIRQAVVRLGARRLTVTRRGRHLTSQIDLRGLPRGTFTVAIRLSTVLGHHISGSRTYHTCVATRHARRSVRHLPASAPSART